MPALSLAAVVPTRDRRELLLSCVDSLLSQERALDEIIVVDNGSRDGTEEAVRRRYGARIRVAREPRPGVDCARNRGIAESSADVLLFTDDDCRPLPGWARALEACFADPAVAGAGGPTRAVWLEEPAPAVRRSPRLNSYLGVVDFGGFRRALHPEREFLVGCNMAWRREALAEPFRGVYPFPPTGVCAEDVELSRRVARTRPVIYEPDAVVEHLILPHKARWSHLLMRGFHFSAARVLLESERSSPRTRLSELLLWELPVSLANAAGRAAGHWARATRGR